MKIKALQKLIVLLLFGRFKPGLLIGFHHGGFIPQNMIHYLQMHSLPTVISCSSIYIEKKGCSARRVMKHDFEVYQDYCLELEPIKHSLL